MAHIFQDENPIVCMDTATGKPSNHYWLNGVHFAEQFPRNWAYSQLPNTGSECRTCMTDAAWCGVIIGYCRQCAKLYRECGDDRGPGFTAFGTEYDETDPASATMTYMADVEWRKVGKPEWLEQQLRQYYYKHANAELSKKLDKSKRKVWCKRDALGGETRMRLAQMEKQIQIRQKVQKKQMKRSVKIELLIHSALLENEVERLNGYKTDIKIIVTSGMKRNARAFIDEFGNVSYAGFNKTIVGSCIINFDLNQLDILPNDFISFFKFLISSSCLFKVSFNS